MIEKDFVQEGLRRTRIDEYLEKELERAGYGGMEVQITPLGTMVIVYAERPGMVIGRGGKNVRTITNTLKNEFGLDNPQIEVKEVEVPELNPKIMAYKISNMLQRGMHFRRVAYSTIRRIMGAGAQGVEVTISGKIRGSRSAVAKFVEGYIKKCGEPSIRLKLYCLILLKSFLQKSSLKKMVKLLKKKSMLKPKKSSKKRLLRKLKISKN